MASFRTLTASGDMTFGKGLNNYSRDSAAIRLDVKTRLLSWLGDCFFAQNEGIDWWNRLGSKGQRDLLEQDIRATILQTEGVREIKSLSTSLRGRVFQADYTVNTVFSSEFTDLVERVI